MLINNVSKKYGATANIIKINSNQYAVKKYLLSPKYYKNNVANEPSRQIKVKAIHYVLFKGEEILEDIKEFTKPHILDDYEYPMNGDVFPIYNESSPFPQQQFTSRWLLGNEGAGHSINQGRGAEIFSSMRTGKSLSCLWAAIAGLKLKLFTKILIVSPKTVMRSTWAKELSTHFLDMSYTIKDGIARDRTSTTPIDIIGWDALTSIIKKKIINTYSLIIYDEATALKTTRSQRYMIFDRWFKETHMRNKTRLWLLTGTPVAQSPVNAYAFIKLIAPNLGPYTLTAWRGMTQYKEWNGSYTNRPNCATICAKALQPSIRFELKDIIEIEDCTPIYLDIEKTSKQTKMFKQLAEKFLIEIAISDHDKPITAANAAVKASKLLQVLSGCIYDEDRNIVDTDASHKLETLIELIDQLPEDQPVIIFAEWTHTINMLKEYLTPIYKTVEVIDGSVGNKDKDNHRNAINQRILNKQTKIGIIHPVTGALGLNFSSTNVIIWFTPTYKAELYQQAKDRVRSFASASQGYLKFFIYHLCCDPLERLIYKSIAEKLLTQDQIFNLIRDTIKKEFAI